MTSIGARDVSQSRRSPRRRLADRCLRRVQSRRCSPSGCDESPDVVPRSNRRAIDVGESCIARHMTVAELRNRVDHPSDATVTHRARSSSVADVAGARRPDRGWPELSRDLIDRSDMRTELDACRMYPGLVALQTSYFGNHGELRRSWRPVNDSRHLHRRTEQIWIVPFRRSRRAAERYVRQMIAHRRPTSRELLTISRLRCLQEHRQALITAAVTGELDIPEWPHDQSERGTSSSSPSATGSVITAATSRSRTTWPKAPSPTSTQSSPSTPASCSPSSARPRSTPGRS